MMDGDAKKSSKNSSKIKYYDHCPDVFDDTKLFTTTRWNIFLKIMDIFKLKTGLLRSYLP